MKKSSLIQDKKFLSSVYVYVRCWLSQIYKKTITSMLKYPIFKKIFLLDIDIIKGDFWA